MDEQPVVRRKILESGTGTGVIAALGNVAVVIEREGGERRVQEVASAREFLQPML